MAKFRTLFFLWKWILLFGVKIFALSLVLKQSFDNSKEADSCGPFIQSIKLKTEFFFDAIADVIDEVLEVESFTYDSKSRKLGNNVTFLLLCLQKDYPASQKTYRIAMSDHYLYLF